MAVGGPKGNMMRREEEVFLKGIFRWCKHLRPDMTYHPGKWSTNIYLEGTELERFRELQAQGIKNRLKQDADGWFATLSRRCSIETKDGRTVGLEPPLVFTLEGDVKVPVTELVGNGSTGVAKCMLWSFNPQPNISGKALRWESLRLDNLIKYEATSKDFPTQKDADNQLNNYEKQEALF